MAATPTHETSVLLPRDPNELDTDAWPIYTLRDAHIHHASTPSTPANLLHASLSLSLQVHGNLERPPRNRLVHAAAFPARMHTCPLQVTEVRQFAYGQYANGSVEIWAAGKAGWFAVKPARAYRATYDDMVEAVQLLYFVVDAYRAPPAQGQHKKRQGNESYRSDLSAQHLFQLYADAHGSKSGGDMTAAAEVFYKHRRFLLASMLGGKEGLAWTTIPLFRHLEHRFADEAAELRQDMSAKPERVRKASTCSPASSSSPKRKRASPQSTQAPARKPRMSAEATSIRTRSSATPASDVLSSAGESTKRGRGLPRQSVDSSVSTPIRPLYPELVASDSDDELVEERPLAKKGKSVLRPKSSKFVAGSTDNDAGSGDDVVEHDAAVNSIAARGRPLPVKASTGDEGGRRRSTRRSSRMDVDADVVNAEQADAGAEDVDEGIDMSLDQEDQSDGDQRLNNNGDRAATPLPFRLRKEDMTSREDGDLWACPLDGCMHRVYAASDPASQILIKEHYRLHVRDDDADMRVQLVRRMEAPGLPVGRLMGRISALAGQRGFPSPIVQRY